MCANDVRKRYNTEEKVNGAMCRYRFYAHRLADIYLRLCDGLMLYTRIQGEAFESSAVLQSKVVGFFV